MQLEGRINNQILGVKGLSDGFSDYMKKVNCEEQLPIENWKTNDSTSWSKIVTTEFLQQYP